jgi:hypothetical protein
MDKQGYELFNYIHHKETKLQMKNFFTTIFAISTLFIFAQTPQGINYQSIIRTSGGTVIPNTIVNIEFKLYNGFLGAMIYHESHLPTTNSFGMANLIIGQGSPISGSFNAITWSNGIAYEVYVNSALIGSKQLFMSVPYALNAGSAPAPTITFTNNVLSVGGNTTTIPAAITYSAGTGIDITGNVISNIAPTQTLSITGNTLDISGGNSVVLPTPSVSVSDYSLTSNSNTLTLSNGTSVTTATVPETGLALTGTSLSSGPTTNSVNLSALNNWTVTSDVIYPAFTNSIGIGTSGPLTDKMEINYPSAPGASHIHFKQTGADPFSRIKFSNAVAPAKYWLNSVTSAPTDNNSGYNFFFFNGISGRNLFTVAGDGKVSVNPFSLSYPTLLEVNGGFELDSTISVNGLNAMPPTSLANTGKIYFDRSQGKFMVSEGGGAFKPLFGSSPWIQGLGIITQSNPGDKVGIGTNTPGALLDIVSTTALNAYALRAINSGTNSGTAFFDVTNSNNADNTIEVNNSGRGSSIRASNTSSTNATAYFNNTGQGMALSLENTSNTDPVAYINNNGSYQALSVTSTSGIAISATNNSSDATIDATNDGQGYTIWATNTNTTLGSAARFENKSSYGTLNVVNSSTGEAINASAISGSAIIANNTGSVTTIYAENSGSADCIQAFAVTGRGINATNTSGTSAAVEIYNDGPYHSLYSLKNAASPNGNVARFENNSTGNTADALFILNKGGGAAIHAISGPTVSGGTNAALQVENGHIRTTFTGTNAIGSGGTNITGPIITRTPAAGYTTNDVSGAVNINFSTVTTIASGQYVEFRVTFLKPYISIPKVIASCHTYPLTVFISGTSLTDCQIVIQNTGSTAVNSVSNIIVNYFVIE